MTTQEAEIASTSSTSKLSVPALTAMVVGSMVGAGVFTLPQRFAAHTGVLGAIIAWVIAGAGMLMLAFVFQSLAVRKPKLDNGVYVYARGGLRQVSRLPVRHRFLGERVRRQHVLLDPDHLDPETTDPGLRRRRHDLGDPRLLGVRLGLLFPDHAGCQGGRRDQRDRHRGEDHPAPPLRGRRDLRVQAGCVRRQLHRRLQRRWSQPVRAGAGDDAGHGLRVPRDRGGERVLAVRQEARGCRPRHRSRIPLRARPLRDGVDHLVRDPPAVRARPPPPALRRQRAGGRRRPLGRLVHQRRTDHLRARRLPRVEPDGSRGPLRCRQGQGPPRLPGKPDQEGGARKRTHPHHPLHPAPAGHRLLLRGRPRLHARPHGRAVADAVRPRRRVRVEDHHHP